jgi:hypothetical protein
MRKKWSSADVRQPFSHIAFYPSGTTYAVNQIRGGTFGRSRLCADAEVRLLFNDGVNKRGEEHA